MAAAAAVTTVVIEKEKETETEKEQEKDTPEEQLTKILKLYEIGRRNEEGDRSLFGVVKELDALLTEHKDREYWVSAILDLHDTYKYLPPEVLHSMWGQLGEICKHVFPMTHPLFLRSIEIVNDTKAKSVDARGANKTTISGVVSKK